MTESIHDRHISQMTDTSTNDRKYKEMTETCSKNPKWQKCVPNDRKYIKGQKKNKSSDKEQYRKVSGDREVA